MASRSTRRIFTLCGVGLWMCKLLDTSEMPKEQFQRFQLACLKVFNQQKDALSIKEARGVRASVVSRFSEERKASDNFGTPLPFSFMEQELTEIEGLVKNGKKENITEMLSALNELRDTIPKVFVLI